MIVKRKRRARYMVASLRIGKKGLVPPGDPLHGPAQAARGPHYQRLLRIVLALVAEAAADIARHDPQLAFVDAELFAHEAPDVMRRLRAAVERVAGRDRAAGLDRGAAQPVVHQLDFHLARRLRERLLDRASIAAPPGEADFILHRLQDFIIHRDLLGGILGEKARLRKDGGDRLADVAHRFARHGPAQRLGHRRAIRHAHVPAGGHRANAVRLHVPAGEHGGRAGTERPADIDRAQAGVRVGRAHDRAMQLARKRQIGDEAAAAGKKTPVLEAPERCADHWISSRSSSSRS